MYNVRVEYDCAPIRHIAVQCPGCQRWFYGNSITEDRLSYEYQLSSATFDCPICGEEFGGRLDKPNIKEVMYPDVYKGCVDA